MLRIDIDQLIFNTDQFDKYKQDHLERRHGITRQDIIDALEFGILNSEEEKRKFI